MRTDLADLFTTMADSGKLQRFPGVTVDAAPAYHAFLSSLERSPHSKIICEARSVDELRYLSILGALFADVTIVTGAGGSRLEMTVPGPAAPPMHIVVPSALADRPLSIGTVSFPSTVIDDWISAAGPFIRDGRLIYVPKRLLMWPEIKEDGSRHWQTESVDLQSPWHVWQLTALNQRAGTVPLVASAASSDPRTIELVRFAMPWLENIDLATLYNVVSECPDSFAEFRKSMREAFATAAATSSQGTESTLAADGRRIREDIIEPATQAINREYRKILRTRGLKLGAAALGTVGLTLTAVSTAGLTGLIAGSATAAALIKQTADLQSDLSDLANKPWYLLWRLQRAT